MTTHHVLDSRELRDALGSGAPGDRYVLHGGTYEPLDTYEQHVVGGTSWSRRTRIEAYTRNGQRDLVTFSGGTFPIRLAHAEASNLEVIGIMCDGRRTAIHALKVTSASDDPGPRNVRFTDCRFFEARHSGVLVNVPQIHFLRGRSFSNGWSENPSDFNKDHGMYLGAGAFDCTVTDFDTLGNAAYGISEYGGELPGGVGRNLIRRGFHFENGRQAMRSGVLISGYGTRVERVMSTGNQYGVHVYRTARAWTVSLDCYLAGNRDGEMYVDPEAQP